jgi:hypothetical protein
MSGENEGCIHSNAQPLREVQAGQEWGVCRMACLCGLRGKGWVYHVDDESGKANAETEARTWWKKNTSRATPPASEIVPEGTTEAIEFYADESNWVHPGGDVNSPVRPKAISDGGETAFKILKQIRDAQKEAPNAQGL